MSQPSPRPLSEPYSFKFGSPLKQAEVDGELARVLAARGIESYQAIHDSYVEFDLSETYWYDLASLLWLISLLHHLKAQANDLRLVLPTTRTSVGRDAWSFLIRWRFFHALAECVDDPINLLPPEQVFLMFGASKYAPARGQDEYGRTTLLHTLRLLEISTIVHPAPRLAAVLPPDPLGPFLAKFKDKTLLGALGTYCGWSNHQASEFANLVIGEGVANSFDHARGSFSLVAMRIDTKNVTLAIADDGRGIPEVLRSSPRVRDDLLQASDVDLIKHFTTEKMILDSFVIDASTRSGVSSKDDRPGVGLFYLKNTVLGDGGELRIRSGRAEVTFADDRVQAKHDDRPLSPGTSLRIVIPRRVRSGG